jgi:Gluconate 2-dehydrogenase subunit 3
VETGYSRRDLFRTLAVVGFATLQLPAAEPDKPLFFDKDEFALLDKLTDLIIPTDDHSPGAHDAGVAKFIDWSTAHQIEPEAKSSWTKGLAEVDALSKELFNVRFLKASDDQQLEVLNRLSGAKGNPSAEQNRFWGQLKDTTTFTYYTSSIGIHNDIQYLGNVILEQFQGFDAN